MWVGGAIRSSSTGSWSTLLRDMQFDFTSDLQSHDPLDLLSQFLFDQFLQFLPDAFSDPFHFCRVMPAIKTMCCGCPTYHADRGGRKRHGSHIDPKNGTEHRTGVSSPSCHPGEGHSCPNSCSRSESMDRCPERRPVVSLCCSPCIVMLKVDFEESGDLTTFHVAFNE